MIWADKEPLVYSSARPWADPNFVLPGLRRGEVGILAAAGATGKSYILQTMCMSIAAGVQIFGFLPVKKPLRTCMINFEDLNDDLCNRGNAILRAYPMLENASLQKNFFSVACPGETLGLIRQTQGESYADLVMKQKVALFCAGYDLLVLDPLSAVFEADENSQRDANMLMQILRQIAMEANVAIIVAHHVSKASMWQQRGNEAAAVRGAGAFIFAARCVMNLSRNDGDSVRLDWTKLNNHAPIPPVVLYRGRHGVLFQPQKMVAYDPALGECYA